jgi:predicted dienelactone hydrolase
VKEYSVWLIVIISALVFALPTAAQQPGADYTARGSYAVGTRAFEIEAGARRLEGTIWYPALVPDGTEETITYSAGISDVAPDMDAFVGHASLDAEPDVTHGPYPLVIFSHGNRSSRFLTAYLFEHLASYGFVVMAVDHTGTAIRDSLTLTPDDYAARSLAGHVDRPADIRQQLDEAERLTAPGGSLAGMIDLEQVAVGGWSFGGYTALAAAGARWDLAALADWCSAQTGQLSPGDSMTCAVLDHQAALASLLGQTDLPDGLWPSLGDPRVDAFFAFAPGRIPMFGPGGMAAVTVPALLVTGSQDSIDPPETNTYAAYDQVSSTLKALVILEGADHMVFAACDGGWVNLGMCSDPVWDLEQAHELIDHFTTAFLLAVLYDDPDAAAVLAPEAVTIDGVRYRAAGF